MVSSSRLWILSYNYFFVRCLQRRFIRSLCVGVAEAAEQGICAQRAYKKKGKGSSSLQEDEVLRLFEKLAIISLGNLKGLRRWFLAAVHKCNFLVKKSICSWEWGIMNTYNVVFLEVWSAIENQIALSGLPYRIWYSWKWILPGNDGIK